MSNPLILGTNSIKDVGYDVANSCMLDEPSNQGFTKTPGSAGNRKTFTLSAWVKRSKITNQTGDVQTIFESREGNNDNCALTFQTNDTLSIKLKVGGTNKSLITNRVFRDVSAWLHLVCAVDTTQSTDSNRVKIYVNGVQETSFGTEDYVSQDAQTSFNNSVGHGIGKRSDTTSQNFDGYLAEVIMIDGSALDPTSFGEFDSDTNIWKPIDVSGLTFGTNGFYLDFEDSSALGNDVSGNNNDFTATNLSATNQSEDSCTNNYVTLNSLLPPHSSTFANGNVQWSPSTASHYYWINSTVGLSQGKWYIEAKLQSAASHNYIGISVDQPDDSTVFLAGGGGSGGANDQYEWGWKSSDGKIYNNTDGGTAYGDTYTTGDILGMYLDLDNNKLYFAKNGTIQNSGTGISITDPASTPHGVYFPCVADGTSGNSSTWEVNFGNPSYGISSANTDPEGYGTFEYSPNDGGSASFDSSAKDFYALNTKNLAEYG